MSTTAPTVPAALQEWRARREEALAAPHGVLAQVGLHWIPADGASHRPDGVPGTWRRTAEGLTVTWESEELTLLTEDPAAVQVERTGETSTVRVLPGGDVRLVSFGDDVQVDVIPRGDRIGLRVLDPQAPRRTGFEGVPVFPYDPDAVLRGTFTPRAAEVEVGSVLPWLTSALPSAGVVTLDVDGEAVELVVTGRSTLIVTDETSGAESADWRQVEARIDGESVEVDLNRALNFPSAFSVWATCPRPPAGNHLPLAVRAGERRVEPTAR